LTTFNVRFQPQADVACICLATTFSTALAIISGPKTNSFWLGAEEATRRVLHDLHGYERKPKADHGRCCDSDECDDGGRSMNKSGRSHSEAYWPDQQVNARDK
jgi:hypothetical protein